MYTAFIYKRYFFSMLIADEKSVQERDTDIKLHLTADKMQNLDSRYWFLTNIMPIAAIKLKPCWHFSQCPAHIHHAGVSSPVLCSSALQLSYVLIPVFQTLFPNSYSSNVFLENVWPLGKWSFCSLVKSTELFYTLCWLTGIRVKYFTPFHPPWFPHFSREWRCNTAY